jgi:hypothetical protein
MQTFILGQQIWKWCSHSKTETGPDAFALDKLYILLEKVYMQLSNIIQQLFEHLVGSILLYMIPRCGAFTW